MKKLLIVFLFPLSVFAQDTIITTKGEVISCRITEVYPQRIYYTTSGKLFSIAPELISEKKLSEPSKNLFFVSVSAQDTIITTKGEVIPCTIIAIAPEYITYRDSLGTFTITNNMVFDKKINGHPFIAEPKTVAVYNEINLAGAELQRASNIFYGGVVAMIIGGGLSLTGAFIHAKNPNGVPGKALIYSGAAIGTIGFFVNISSFSAISNAGKHLSKVKID